ncbi:hypothetical protein [uncultured Victivallis sp.]|uniref:hypothetical protein n=1 Tax=uncultured Victivallis sp. TaxID=354118 RepID=UPI002585AEDA|nr:hypothetical protein [uncultured Victivallis sp.]
MMDQREINTYKFIANRALYELRLFTAPYLQGPSFFAGFLPRSRRRIKFIARFAYVFHNLALAQERQYMADFDESVFWNDIASLKKDFSDLMITDYHELFQQYLSEIDDE